MAESDPSPQPCTDIEREQDRVDGNDSAPDVIGSIIGCTGGISLAKSCPLLSAMQFRRGAECCLSRFTYRKL